MGHPSHVTINKLFPLDLPPFPRYFYCFFLYSYIIFHLPSLSAIPPNSVRRSGRRRYRPKGVNRTGEGGDKGMC